MPLNSNWLNLWKKRMNKKNKIRCRKFKNEKKLYN